MKFVNLLAVVVALFVSAVSSADEARDSDVSVRMEVHGTHREMIGESADLNDLHEVVSNNFEAVIAREIKAKRLAVSNFTARIGRKGNKYTLAYRVDLTPVAQEQNAHQVFSVRGRVWSDKHGGARDGVRKLYRETVVPWQQRMKEEYPDVTFTFDVKENGDDTLFQKTCIAKGGKK